MKNTFPYTILNLAAAVVVTFGITSPAFSGVPNPSDRLVNLWDHCSKNKFFSEAGDSIRSEERKLCQQGNAAYDKANRAHWSVCDEAYDLVEKMDLAEGHSYHGDPEENDNVKAPTAGEKASAKKGLNALLAKIKETRVALDASVKKIKKKGKDVHPMGTCGTAVEESLSDLDELEKFISNEVQTFSAGS